jgi:hypothetical protein
MPSSDFESRRAGDDHILAFDAHWTLAFAHAL